MSDIEIFKSLYGELVEFHQRALGYAAHLTGGIKSGVYSKPGLVDIGFLFRQFENLLDDFRKDCKVRKELCGKIIAMRQLADNLQSGSVEDTIHGSLARGSVDVKNQAKIPKRDSREYHLLMGALKIPENVRGLVKIDWKQAGELATKCAAEGVPLPAGLDETYPVYSTKFTRKGK